LFALRKVIKALSRKASGDVPLSNDTNNYIPYRDSKLTSLLK